MVGKIELPDYAIAVNAERARSGEEAGADVIQLDEPWLRNDPEAAKRVAVKAINRALEGLKGADHRASVLRLRGARFPGDQAGHGYSFLPQLADRQPPSRFPSRRRNPKLDLGVLKELAGEEDSCLA